MQSLKKHFVEQLFATKCHLPNFTDHPCRRNCKRHREPLTCEYVLKVSWRTTMGRDCQRCPSEFEDCFRHGCILGSGNQRAVAVGNEMLPGPAIEVCEGDFVVIKTMNGLVNGESLAIHFHGLHQRGTPYMDGAGLVTQCPILPMQSFAYEFEAKEAGTHFWHSHMGTQRADGLAGPFIVRSRNDPNDYLYDRDNLRPIMFQDWFPNETFTNRFAKHRYGDGDRDPALILANGIWASPDNWYDHGDELPKLPIEVPAYKYLLHNKMRYRFRLINNAFFDVPMRVEMECHNLIVIASDGYPVRPVATKSLTLFNAERYDIVPYFTCNKAERNDKAKYRLFVRGLGDAEDSEQAVSWVDVIYFDKRGKRKNPRRKSLEKACGNRCHRVYNEINYWDWTPYRMYPGSRDGLKVADLESYDKGYDIQGTPDFRYLISFVSIFYCY